LLVEC
jgi:hypothetical protein